MTTGEMGGVLAVAANEVSIPDEFEPSPIPARRPGSNATVRHRSHLTGLRARILRSVVSNQNDDALTATYVRVLVIEAVIIVLLWLIGRAFAPLP
jgi:hypothetical protein